MPYPAEAGNFRVVWPRANPEAAVARPRLVGERVSVAMANTQARTDPSDDGPDASRGREPDSQHLWASHLWTCRMVGEYVHVKPARVRQWRREGKLRAAGRRPGPRGAWLFDPEDVRAMVQVKEAQPRLVSDVEAIINAELNKVRRNGR